MNNRLVTRAKNAFTPAFKRLLEDSVLCFINSGGKIKTIKDAYTVDNCRCPFGCLPNLSPFPSSRFCEQYFAAKRTFPAFTAQQIHGFINSFDIGEDYGTPESALGLLYRKKFIE